MQQINVTLNDGTKINGISYENFISNYRNLIKEVTEVEIISGSEIPGWAFASFKNLEKVYIYPGIKYVADGAFNTGGTIEKIVKPDTLNLNKNVFADDESNYPFMYEGYSFTQVKEIATYNNENRPMLEQNSNEFQLQ